jgi:hypothetical protein
MSEEFRLHTKVGVERAGGVAVAAGCIILLEAIERRESLAATTWELNVPHRLAKLKQRDP